MKKFAVFDIDGTLIRWQLYHAVVDYLAREGLLGQYDHETLHQARMVWKRREHPNAFKDYEKTLIKVYEDSLHGLSTKDFDIAAETVAHEYKEQVYNYTRGLAATLKNKGYVLLAISGSHQELVKHVAMQYGFDDWVGTVYQREGDNFTGSKTVASLDKKKALQNLAEKHDLTYEDSYGIGDSASDASLLEAVENPIAFNPDQQLFSMAKEKNWDIVIERKNVIYNLKDHDGKYILAETV